MRTLGKLFHKNPKFLQYYFSSLGLFSILKLILKDIFYLEIIVENCLFMFLKDFFLKDVPYVIKFKKPIPF